MMTRKTSIVLGVVATIGAIIGGSQLRPVEELLRATKDYRLALIGEACFTSKAVCDHKYAINGDLCMCQTDDQNTQPNEITDIDTLSASRHFAFLVCRNKADPAIMTAHWHPFGALPPIGWACETIHAKGVREKSVRNAESELVKSLKQLCCAACVGDCFVTPGEWGVCPYCLLDSSCNKFCS